ncbi:MAG: hypothetical protein NVSMB42_20170 [Herpetosiphon sp.]
MLDHERGDTSVLTTLFAHNAWANLKLLACCEGLSGEQLDTTPNNGYGCIRRTLLHFVGAEASYVVRVNGKLPAKPFARDQFPGFAVLKDAVRWTGDELLQLAFSTQTTTIVRESPADDRIRYPLASLLVQAVTHST